MSAANLFPLFLKLTGRKCLVVGGGHECAEKARGLLNSGASVHVVAKDVTEEIRDAHDRGILVLHDRSFRSADLDGVTLVVAADPDQSINEQVFSDASERGILCNVIDQPPLCDFYYPAVVRRGHLQIAISTNGLSPALASSIRTDLERVFGPLYSEWVERLGKVRTRILRTRPKSAARTALLQSIASQSRFDRFQRRRARQQKGAQ